MSTPSRATPRGSPAWARFARYIGLKLTVVLIILGGVWPLMIQTMYGVQDVDPVARDTARVSGVGTLRPLYRPQADGGPDHPRRRLAADDPDDVRRAGCRPRRARHRAGLRRGHASPVISASS